MKTRILLLIGAVVLIGGTSAVAQDDAERSPSDLPPPAADDAEGVQGIMEPHDTWFSEPCDDCAPWRLFPVGPRGLQITGWVNGGAVGNADSPGSGFNGPFNWVDQTGGSLNQFYLSAERPFFINQEWLDLRGRVDLLYGTDYRLAQARGLERTSTGENRWNGENADYGGAMPQAYLQLGLGEWAVQFGHFYSPLGYEGVMAPANPFYSRSYSMQYAAPQTFTGALAMWQFAESLQLYSGVHNGWDTFRSDDPHAGFLGGVNWSPLAQPWSLRFGITAGEEPTTSYLPYNPGVSYANRTQYNVVFDWQVSERMEWVLEHNRGTQENFWDTGTSASWYGFTKYMFYRFDPCWQLGFRFEWFRDEEGFRVAGWHPLNPNKGVYPGEFVEATLGLQWTPNSNLTVRPELRWDRYSGPGRPFNDGTDDTQFTAAVDAIVLF